LESRFFIHGKISGGMELIECLSVFHQFENHAGL
jgi:hypothetical protein